MGALERVASDRRSQAPNLARLLSVDDAEAAARSLLNQLARARTRTFFLSWAAMLANGNLGHQGALDILDDALALAGFSMRKPPEIERPRAVLFARPEAGRARRRNGDREDRPALVA